MSGLGLGGYGSDDDDSQNSQPQRPEDEQPGARTVLLDSYTSAEALDEDAVDVVTPSAGRGFNAAPEVDQGQTGSDQGPASDDAQPQESPPSRPPSRAPALMHDTAAIAEIYLSDLPAELRNPPPGEVKPEVVEHLRRLIGTRDPQGRTFIERLRQHRDYSNPNLLEHLVEVNDLDTYGTAFDLDVYNPKALPPEDFKDELGKEIDREAERRRNERAANPAVNAAHFHHGGHMHASHSTGGLQQQMALAQAKAQAMQAASQKLGAGAAVGAAALQVAAERSKRSKWDSAK